MAPLVALGVALVSAAPAPSGSAVFPLAPQVTIAPEDLLENDGRVPDYLRAVAGVNPDYAATLAYLTRTVLYGGTLSPSLKLAMVGRVATLCGARYASAHIRRLAAATPVEPADRERTPLAVRFAERLTRDIHGVTDEDFAQLKTRFNEAQLVELTMVTCFANYFTRLTNGLGVAPEPWLATTRPRIPHPAENPLAQARIALVSDAELHAGAAVRERWGSNGPGNSLGVGIPNSLRAMMRVPDLYDAWAGRWQKVNAANANPVPRSILLQVSLAVSTVNGCRYCVVHQIVGLRRQGVPTDKLLALQKDDSALTPVEKAAVDFARKLTRSPEAINEADRLALQKAFPGAAAYEVLHQTCRFAFMNRFTDTLRLPSEDEAVKIYKETFGTEADERGRPR